MDEWQIVAILDRSAGNESVGEMWQETKVFDPEMSLIHVLNWAATATHSGTADKFRGNLKLTIAQ